MARKKPRKKTSRRNARVRSGTSSGDGHMVVGKLTMDRMTRISNEGTADQLWAETIDVLTRVLGEMTADNFVLMREILQDNLPDAVPDLVRHERVAALIQMPDWPNLTLDQRILMLTIVWHSDESGSLELEEDDQHTHLRALTAVTLAELSMFNEALASLERG